MVRGLIHCTKQLTALVDVLIEKGANIHACFEDMITPLYGAARNGHDEIVLKLIKKGADYRRIGDKFTNGDLIIPLQIAGMYGHTNVVKLLLNYRHTSNELTPALDYTFGAMMQCRDFKLRQKIHACSDLIKNELTKFPALKILTLNDNVVINWEESFTILFSQDASNKDKFPSDKDSAIRYALTSIYLLLKNPKSCIPYLQHLSSELEQYWQKEHGVRSFPKFDFNRIELWAHQALLWPIPKEEDYQGIKKFSLLDNILLDKFKQYGMGDEQYKWTGFIPESQSNPLLLKNVFFTENRRTINGFFHVYGTTHTNKTLCNELSKLKLELFSGFPEFAIQMDEKKALAAVKKIDEAQEEGEERWSILSKHYKLLKEPTTPYRTYLNKQFFLFNTKKTVAHETSQSMSPSYSLSGS
jgi:hypothetical protein